MHNEDTHDNDELRGEDLQPEEATSEETKEDTSSASEVKTEASTTEESGAEEPAPKESKPEEAKPEEAKSEEPAAEETKPHGVIGIRFESCGKIYCFKGNGMGLKVGERVVVESDLGTSIGRVVVEDEIPKDSEKELKPVLRRVTEEDLRKEQDNRQLEKEAFDFCNERIMARGLAMKLLGTGVTLDRKRIVFFFAAETRIDFRELVKDLAAKFRTRIELRQVGVRDAARITGGLGICGRELCCRRFLTSFLPISIKMAKQQELALNTSKLSGVCGRLMCCLGYEYEEKLKELRKKKTEKPEHKEPETREPVREAPVETPKVESELPKAEPASREEAPGGEGDATKRKRRRRRRRGKRPEGERSGAPGQQQSQQQTQQQRPQQAQAKDTGDGQSGRPSGERPSGEKPSEGQKHPGKPFRKKRRRRMKGKKNE